MTAVSGEWLAGRLAGPARHFAVSIPRVASDLLARYADLLLEWGARVNLTGARTPEALTDEHLADALAFFPRLPREAFRFVDVGSGAGLPGLVIALLRPDAQAVLLEPTQKKCRFLVHAIRALDLADRIEARPERLADHLLRGGRSAYEVAISRAVWPARDWLGLGAPLLKPSGVLLGVEGSEPGELPVGAVRHRYRLGKRTRAVIELRC